jgi:hypothetical protein
LGSPIVIREREQVEDAVAILGTVTVEGEVTGDVVAILGDVRLGPHAVVRGEVTTIGGRIDAQPEARLLGGANEIALALPGPPHLPHSRWWAGAMSGLTVSMLLFVGIVGLVAVLVGGTLYRRSGENAAHAPWQAVVIGMGAQVLLLPVFGMVCLALLVSIIGIPLLALVPLGAGLLGIVWIVAFAAVLERIGRRVLGGRGSAAPPVVAFLTGFVTVTALLWLAPLAWWTGGIGPVTASVIAGLGFVAVAIAWSAAAGALVLAWLRTKRADAEPAAELTERPATT